MSASPSPAAAPGRKTAARLLIALGVGVVLVAVVVFAVFNNVLGGKAGPQDSGSDPASLQVGECVVYVLAAGAGPAAGGQVQASYRVVDCQSGQFNWVVASVTSGPGSCPNSDYASFFQQRQFVNSTKTTVCLAPNLVVNTCYASDQTQGLQVVDCAAAQAEFKISAILQDGDVNSCERPEQAFNLPEPAPAKVACVSAPR